MLVEAVVLDRDDRLDHGPGDLAQRDVDAVLVVERGDQVAVGVEDPGLLRQRPRSRARPGGCPCVLATSLGADARRRRRRGWPGRRRGRPCTAATAAITPRWDAHATGGDARRGARTCASRVRERARPVPIRDRQVTSHIGLGRFGPDRVCLRRAADSLPLYLDGTFVGRWRHGDAVSSDDRGDVIMWIEDWAPRPRAAGSSRTQLFVRGAEQNKAKQVCAGCPVRTECLAEALDNQIEWGVWGGMTERERRALLRRRPNASWRAVLEAARERSGSRQACRLTARPYPASTGVRSASGQQLADLAQPVEVVHVAGQRRHHGGRHLSGARPRTARAAAPRARPAGPGRRAAAAARRSATSGVAACAAASAAAIASSADSVARRLRAGPVDDQAGQRHLVLAEPLDEVRRLAQRVRLRRGDHEERRPVGLQQLEGLLRRAAGSRRRGCRTRRRTSACRCSTWAPRTLVSALVTSAEAGGHQPGRAPRRAPAAAG